MWTLPLAVTGDVYPYRGQQLPALIYYVEEEEEEEEERSAGSRARMGVLEPGLKEGANRRRIAGQQEEDGDVQQQRTMTCVSISYKCVHVCVTIS